jgi:hypothetical protein
VPRELLHDVPPATPAARLRLEGPSCRPLHDAPLRPPSWEAYAADEGETSARTARRRSPALSTRILAVALADGGRDMAARWHSAKVGEAAETSLAY